MTLLRKWKNKPQSWKYIFRTQIREKKKNLYPEYFLKELNTLQQENKQPNYH